MIAVNNRCARLRGASLVSTALSGHSHLLCTFFFWSTSVLNLPAYYFFQRFYYCIQSQAWCYRLLSNTFWTVSGPQCFPDFLLPVCHSPSIRPSPSLKFSYLLLVFDELYLYHVRHCISCAVFRPFREFTCVVMAVDKMNHYIQHLRSHLLLFV